MFVDKIELPKNYNRPKCPKCYKVTKEFLIDIHSITDSQKELFKFFVDEGLVRFQSEGDDLINPEAIIFICENCMGEGEDYMKIFDEK